MYPGGIKLAIKNIIGNKYGKLTVIEFSHMKGENSYWKCKCECGNEIIRGRSYLTSKKAAERIQSCGCYQKECARKSCKKLKEINKNNKYRKKHGDRHTIFYSKYCGILRRCNNKNDINYKHYGARGIKCLWSSYEDFKKDMYKSYLEHCNKYGEKNTTIDRIDVNGNYCKENCRWETIENQRMNKTITIHVEMEDGTFCTLKYISNKYNINYKTLLSRYQRSKYNHTHKIPFNELIKDKDIV